MQSRAEEVQGRTGLVRSFPSNWEFKEPMLGVIRVLIFDFIKIKVRVELQMGAGMKEFFLGASIHLLIGEVKIPITLASI